MSAKKIYTLSTWQAYITLPSWIRKRVQEEQKKHILGEYLIKTGKKYKESYHKTFYRLLFWIWILSSLTYSQEYLSLDGTPFRDSRRIQRSIILHLLYIFVSLWAHSSKKKSESSSIMDSSYVGFCSVVFIPFSTQTSAQKSNTDSRTILPRYIELSIRKSSILSKPTIFIRAFSLIFMIPMKIVNYPWKIIL